MAVGVPQAISSGGVGLVCSSTSLTPTGGIVKKSDREIMDILEAFDLTKTPHSAAALAGCDEKTVARYVAARDAGRDPFAPIDRGSLIDGWLPKIEEWIDASDAKVRADVVHDRLVVMGYGGSDRTTRRAVATAKARWRAGHRRTYRPWITEPGMWLQFDWGAGPIIDGRPTWLFCAWLAWSRFRVVIPTWDRTLPSLLSCLDATFRTIGGAPTYVLTDNERTVTIDRIAEVPIRHPELVAAGRHYGVTVRSCEPFDPETKGGSEATVRIAKADLVPTTANLLPGYSSFAELQAACEAFAEKVNGRIHRETARRPIDRLAEELPLLHRLPAEPHTTALGQTRTVYTDQCIRVGETRYSTPPGHVGTQVWQHARGEELVITARTDRGLVEIARHRKALPGDHQIDDAHYPDHPGIGGPQPPRPRARTDAEAAFLALGPGAHAWLIEAGASGVTKARVKMADAVQLAALFSTDLIDRALGLAAAAGRFAEADLAAIANHLAYGTTDPAELVAIDEDHSCQPGTAAWNGLGR
jgi:transposase